MNEIDKLIQQLCPDGVEYKKLGEVGTFVRGNGIQKKDFTETGVGCIHYGQLYTFYKTASTGQTKTFISHDLAAKCKKASPGDIVIATTSENVEDVCKAVAWLGKEDIAVSGDAYIFKHNLNAKYVSYIFQTSSFFEHKKKYATGTKVIRVSGDNIAKFPIPVPPLPIQEKIVEVLDKFTKLEAELEARRKQYEYYREKLLTFNTPPNSGNVRWFALGEIGEGMHVQKNNETSNFKKRRHSFLQDRLIRRNS